jgi:hypothetical protein
MGGVEWVASLWTTRDGVSRSGIYDCMKYKPGINVLYDTLAKSTNKLRLFLNVPRTILGFEANGHQMRCMSRYEYQNQNQFPHADIEVRICGTHVV